jgi:hypothetical protein
MDYGDVLAAIAIVVVLVMLIVSLKLIYEDDGNGKT